MVKLALKYKKISFTVNIRSTKTCVNFELVFLSYLCGNTFRGHFTGGVGRNRMILLKHNSEFKMEEIKSSTLQITGIFTRMQREKYTPEFAMGEVLRRTEKIDTNAEKMNNSIIETRKKLAHVSSQNYQLKQEISKLNTELLKLKKEKDNLSKYLSVFVNETFDDNSDTFSDDLPVHQSSLSNPGTPLLQSIPNPILSDPHSAPPNATAESQSETSQDSTSHSLQS